MYEFAGPEVWDKYFGIIEKIAKKYPNVKTVNQITLYLYAYFID